MRPRWTQDAVEALFALPFNDLLFQAQGVHRSYFDANEIQLSTLLSIKTGGCPEDCGYCPQSVRFNTGVAEQELLPLDEVLAAARAAKANGATRFCMGAAWRGPKQRDLEHVLEMVKAVRGLGMETCATLGMLKDGQAEQLSEAGLDYYNHNLDTAADFYGHIAHTRGQQDRMDTLVKVRAAGLSVCCGGIVGMGESRSQRAALIAQLASMEPYPESVPINNLVQVEGTPLAGTAALDPLGCSHHRCGALRCHARVYACRRAHAEMSEAIQALCFLAGANSIFIAAVTTEPGSRARYRVDEQAWAACGSS
jgi:biotin synthase